MAFSFSQTFTRRWKRISRHSLPFVRRIDFSCGEEVRRGNKMKTHDRYSCSRATCLLPWQHAGVRSRAVMMDRPRFGGVRRGWTPRVGRFPVPCRRHRDVRSSRPPLGSCGMGMSAVLRYSHRKTEEGFVTTLFVPFHELPQVEAERKCGS